MLRLILKNFYHEPHELGEEEFLTAKAKKAHKGDEEVLIGLENLTEHGDMSNYRKKEERAGQVLLSFFALFAFVVDLFNSVCL
jgi:hypothetical protein